MTASIGPNWSHGKEAVSGVTHGMFGAAPGGAGGAPVGI